MMTYLSVYCAGLLTLIVGDLLWLGFLMKAFYANRLGGLMAPTITWWAAVAFYIAYTFAVWWFVVSPATDKSLTSVALQGALFGALSYAVYDLTNQATLRGWPVEVTLIDISWGAFLTMLMAVVMRLVMTYMVVPRG